MSAFPARFTPTSRSGRAVAESPADRNLPPTIYFKERPCRAYTTRRHASTSKYRYPIHRFGCHQERLSERSAALVAAALCRRAVGATFTPHPFRDSCPEFRQTVRHRSFTPNPLRGPTVPLHRPPSLPDRQSHKAALVGRKPSPTEPSFRDATKPCPGCKPEPSLLGSETPHGGTSPGRPK